MKSEQREHRVPNMSVETTPTEESVRTYFDLANTYFGIDDPVELIGPEYDIEQILRDIQDGRRFVQTLTIDGETKGGSIATYVDAARATEMWGITEPVVLLEYTVLPEDVRGQGLVLRHCEAQNTWTKEKGCHRQVSEVEYENIPSLIALMKQGFYVTRAEYPEQEAPFLVLQKDIDTDGERVYDSYQEVSYADTGTIEALLEDEWVGIDLKNLADVRNGDRNNWKLIMAK